MAVTEIHPITTTLNKALDYIMNQKQTDDKLLVDGFGCSPEIAFYQFNHIKKNAEKTDGTLALHLIQSFASGEVDYETIHKIGIELADKILKGRFQYVIATHTDRGHVHNHILINSVSFKDKKKYHSTPNSYYYIHRTSDMLCKEYNLSIIKNPKEKGKSHYEHSLDKKGQSWKSLLRQNIDRCIIKARDWDEFLLLMQKEKYEIKSGKYISFRAEGQERFTRSKTLGADYTDEQIRSRIAGGKRFEIENTQRVSLIIDIENAMKERQRNPEAYKRWATLQNLKTVVFKERYRKEHEADLIIFSAAEKYLKKRFNGGKAPLIKELRDEQKSLQAEKDKLYKSYYSEKSELSELETMKKNIDMILGRDVSKEQKRSKKRSGELE